MEDIIMSRAQENIRVEPVDVKFAQVQTDCVEVEAAGALEDLYWEVAGSSTSWYIWYDEGSGVDPSLAGKVAIPVVLAPTDTASQVATKVAAAIDAESGISAIVDPKKSTRVIVKVLEYAAGTPASAGTTTGHMFENVHVGFMHDFGATDGSLELSLDQQLLDVNSTQSGTEILTSLVTGMNVEITIPLKEISDDNLERLIDLTSGGSHTPGSGTKLQGFGSGQNFSNVLDKAGRLILHPTRLPDSDTSQDYCCWLAYPKLDSISFSGESEQLINVTWRVFTDTFLPEDMNKVAIGDHTQL
jgi:hypothetical protein